MTSSPTVAPADPISEAMSAAALELQARRALDAWERDGHGMRSVYWTHYGSLGSDCRRSGHSWLASDHIALARKMRLLPPEK